MNSRAELEIRNPKIICAKAVGKSAEVLFRLHDHQVSTGMV